MKAVSIQHTLSTMISIVTTSVKYTFLFLEWISNIQHCNQGYSSNQKQTDLTTITRGAEANHKRMANKGNQGL